MTLEETIRAYAKKGELVHLSLAFSNGEFHANFAAASPHGGYARGVHLDPVEALVAAFKASPSKPARVSKPRDLASVGDEITAAVSEPPLVSDEAYAELLQRQGLAVTEPQEKTGTLGEWTTP